MWRLQRSRGRPWPPKHLSRCSRGAGRGRDARAASLAAPKPGVRPRTLAAARRAQHAAKYRRLRPSCALALPLSPLRAHPSNSRGQQRAAAGCTAAPASVGCSGAMADTGGRRPACCSPAPSSQRSCTTHATAGGVQRSLPWRRAGGAAGHACGAPGASARTQSTLPLPAPCRRRYHAALWRGRKRAGQPR